MADILRGWGDSSMARVKLDFYDLPRKIYCDGMINEKGGRIDFKVYDSEKVAEGVSSFGILSPHSFKR